MDKESIDTLKQIIIKAEARDELVLYIANKIDELKKEGADAESSQYNEALEDVKFLFRDLVFDYFKSDHDKK